MMEDEQNLKELCLTWQHQMRQAAAWAGAGEPRVQYSACPETGGCVGFFLWVLSAIADFCCKLSSTMQHHFTVTHSTHPPTHIHTHT